MRNILLSLTTIFLVVSQAASAAPAKDSCSDLPAQWTVNNTQLDGVTPSLITNDGVAAYVNGQNGVTAFVTTCSTGEAVVALSGTGRAISFHFTEPLYTDGYTPPGLGGSTVNVASVTVMNIMYQHNAAAEYTFTTRLGSDSSVGPFRMVNLGSQAVPPGQGGDNVANSPYADALVYVHHCPKSTVAGLTCPALAHETYYVYPDPAVYGTSSSTGMPITQVGTVILTEGNGKNAQTVNAGEFSMPFYFAISLLQ